MLFHWVTDGVHFYSQYQQFLYNTISDFREKDIGTGVLGVIGNIIWFIIAGIWLAILNVVWGAVWCVTIIGIPFGMQCFKLAGASLVPIGKTVVKNELAVAAKKQNAEDQLTELRSKD